MFSVANKRYSISISDSPIIFNGDCCDGICDEKEQSIKISARCRKEKRLFCLLHELAHAWIFETARPLGIESICDFVATVSEQAIKDLVLHGGEFELRQLNDGDKFDIRNARRPLTKNRACADCLGTIAANSVIARQDPENSSVVILQAYCEHCNAVWAWKELATMPGIPSGITVGIADKLSGDDRRKWLKDNPIHARESFG